MALQCEMCGKGSKKAASRSHSKIKTLRRQKPNLQKMDGKLVCTRCIRTASKVANAKAKAAANDNTATEEKVAA